MKMFITASVGGGACTPSPPWPHMQRKIMKMLMTASVGGGLPPNHPWESMKIYWILWKSMRIHKHLGHLMEIHGNPWTSMKFNGNPWESMKTYEIRWGSMDIHENQWNSMEIHGNVGSCSSAQSRTVRTVPHEFRTVPHTSLFHIKNKAKCWYFFRIAGIWWKRMLYKSRREQPKAQEQPETTRKQIKECLVGRTLGVGVLATHSRCECK